MTPPPPLATIRQSNETAERRNTRTRTSRATPCCSFTLSLASSEKQHAEIEKLQNSFALSLILGCHDSSRTANTSLLPVGRCQPQRYMPAVRNHRLAHCLLKKRRVCVSYLRTFSHFLSATQCNRYYSIAAFPTVIAVILVDEDC